MGFDAPRGAGLRRSRRCARPAEPREEVWGAVGPLLLLALAGPGLDRCLSPFLSVCKEPPYKVEESGYAGFIMPIEVYFKNKVGPQQGCGSQKGSRPGVHGDGAWGFLAVERSESEHGRAGEAARPSVP